MSTEMIINHCAPTLAGLKIGNLFSCKYDNINDLRNKVVEKNALLNSKGVYFVILKAHNGSALIFVYRKKLLQHTLKQTAIRNFLKEYGYEDFAISSCFSILKKHLLHSNFPHEIGVFLGYPLNDIKDFIHHKGKHCHCVGCWKAYNNIHEAQKTFNKFKKCTNIYSQKFSQGFEITRLTVVG